jgi:UDP-N-acetylmuramoyl-L-alanyl-D-glutamate--2,6-diaminopimelate ligase
VAKLADVAIVTSDNPRHEEPRRIAHDVLRGMSGCESVYSVLDRHEAIHLALESAREGDCVLLAGKGHEREQIIGDERHPSDDRQIAREWLYRAEREMHVERAKAA